MNIEELDYQESAAKPHHLVPTSDSTKYELVLRTCGNQFPLTYYSSMAFPIDDRKMKRAGLDYWDKLDVHVSMIA